VVARKRRQVSVERLVAHNKTAASICSHCLPVLRRPVKHF